MTAFYSEWEPYAAAWTRNLIDAGHVAPGVVDERSIVDLKASDLDGFTQCHFFSGIAVWSYALRLAGWPDDLEVWTGSCPCQPFSRAGKRTGKSDERHLWPVWFDLIRERRPALVCGEQVAGEDGLDWFDAVSADLEAAGYAVTAANLGAASVGAPHIRQRLYFVAIRGDVFAARHDATASLPVEAFISKRRRGRAKARVVGHARVDGAGEHAGELRGDEGEHEIGGEDGDHASVLAGPTRGWWEHAEWVYCRDDSYRAVEPGTLPVDDGPPERLAQLRAYGNSLVAPLAAEFIRTVIDVLVGTDE